MKKKKVSKIPLGKVSLYHYISSQNKAWLKTHSDMRGISESRLLDFILEQAREKVAEKEPRIL